MENDHLIAEDDGSLYAGNHVILDLYDCDQAKLDDIAFITEAMDAAIAAGGATKLYSYYHHFTGGGVTGVSVLSESHISVHTWDKAGYAAFDVFMCGRSNPSAAADSLIESFSPQRHEKTVMKRGRSL